MNEFQIDYLTGQQCSNQWRGYLTALAAEFDGQLSVDDLCTLNRRIGVRFASVTPIAICRTLPELESEINRIWLERGWGYVHLREEDAGLRLIHYCAPLRAAFGEEALSWTPAYLEGVYSKWFSASGAGSSLQLKQISKCDYLGTIEYLLHSI
jgi:hypothetical protein